jgi:hypothetical protein
MERRNGWLAAAVEEEANGLHQTLLQFLEVRLRSAKGA